MKSWRTWLAGLTTVMLAACGGGGNSGTPIVGGPGTPTVADLQVVLSEATIPNDPTKNVTVTVTAVDSGGRAMADVPVTLGVNNNAAVTSTATKTDSEGRIVGTVTIGADRTLRTITVSATAGSVTKSAPLQVVESNAVKKAADLSVTLSKPTLENSGTQTVTVTAVAVDANRNTVSEIPVTLAVNAGATIRVNSSQTDADGKVTGTIGIGDDKSNRTITVTATSGTIVRTTVLQVTGAQVKTTLLPAVLNVGSPGKIQYRLLDVSGNAIAGRTVTVVGPGGVQSTGTSDLNGDYEYSYTAGAAGELNIRASAVGVDVTSTVIVQVGALPDVTTDVQSASVSVSPNVIPVNTASTKNQATVRALFIAAGNKPIPNIRVRFDLDGDPQAIGGTFTSGATMVYSDASGVASTSYMPGARFSPTDGVTVRACWDKKDFAVGSCPNQTKATLTVISDSLSVSIGSDFLVGEDETKLKYRMRFVVQVVDSSGLAAADVDVSAAVDLLTYQKGFWELGFNSQGRALWLQRAKATCDNEDLNRNGIAEVFSNGVVEDANNSFNRTNGRPALEPRKADVAISYEGSSRTSAGGAVVLRIEYPKSIGSWVNFNLVVSASGVAGTEGRANLVSPLWVPAAVVNDIASDPPFIRSPYGILTSPLVVARDPDPRNTRPAASLCTEPD